MLFAVSGVINIIADNFSQFFFMLQVLKILLLIPFFKVTTIVANDIYKLNPNHLSFNDELKVDLSSKKVLFASGSPSLPTGYFSKSSTFFKRLENIMSKKIPDPLINEHRELHKKLQDINTLYSGIN